MNIAFWVEWNVVVEHMRDMFDVETTRCHIRSNQNFNLVCAESSHHTVTLHLTQIAMQGLGRKRASRKALSKIIHRTFRATEDNRRCWCFIVEDTSQAPRTYRVPQLRNIPGESAVLSIAQLPPRCAPQNAGSVSPAKQLDRASSPKTA